mmetsp:Transcript_13052/g.30883  ORF Transcript_13052/g.30883 Transcript_13052/m.30883 type:complete len:209 (-) Transcript_13052:1051-1677(-)
MASLKSFPLEHQLEHLHKIQRHHKTARVPYPPRLLRNDPHQTQRPVWELHARQSLQRSGQHQAPRRDPLQVYLVWGNCPPRTLQGDLHQTQLLARQLAILRHGRRLGQLFQLHGSFNRLDTMAKVAKEKEEKALPTTLARATITTTRTMEKEERVARERAAKVGRVARVARKAVVRIATIIMEKERERVAKAARVVREVEATLLYRVP